MRPLLLPAFVLAGCGGSVPSNDVRTSGIYATFVVEQSTATSITASATLRADNATGAKLDLAGDDRVSCNGAALDGTNALPIAAASKYEFVLDRKSDDARVTVAPPFEFAVTSAALDGTYDSQFTITWSSEDPLPARINIDATSTTPACTDRSLATHAADTGSFAFDGSSFGTSDKTTPDCLYTLRIEREIVTPVPPDLAGGEAIARFVQLTTIHVHA